jgi:hypothetical protein
MLDAVTPDYPVHTLPDARQSLAVLKQRYLDGRVPADAFMLLRQYIAKAIARHEARYKIERTGIQ